MEISLIQAILLGLFCFLVNTGMFPLGWLSMNIISKPLIQAMIIGLIMGDVSDALIIGSVIQAAYIGQMSIGGVATLPTISYSLWFALPMAIVSGGDAAQCLTICLAFAAVESIGKTVGNIFKVAFLHRQDALIEKGEIKKAWWYPVLGHIWTLVCSALISVICLIGTDVVVSFINSLPQEINAITNTFTGMLPAIGFMLLLVGLIHDKLQWIYFLFGFVLAAGLGWDTITITVVGCVIAYLVFQFTTNKSDTVTEEDDD